MYKGLLAHKDNITHTAIIGLTENRAPLYGFICQWATHTFFLFPDRLHGVLKNKQAPQK